MACGRGSRRALAGVPGRPARPCVCGARAESHPSRRAWSAQDGRLHPQSHHERMVRPGLASLDGRTRGNTFENACFCCLTASSLHCPPTPRYTQLTIKSHMQLRYAKLYRPGWRRRGALNADQPQAHNSQPPLANPLRASARSARNLRRTTSHRAAEREGSRGAMPTSTERPDQREASPQAAPACTSGRRCAPRARSSDTLLHSIRRQSPAAGKGCSTQRPQYESYCMTDQ